MKTSEFNTLAEPSPNFYETRILQSQNPLWHFSLMYEYLKDNPGDLVAALSPHTDYRYLAGFLLSMQGEYGEFLFDDFTDDAFGMRSAPGGLIATPSVARVTTYPTAENFYPAGSYVLDNNNPPHLQLVTQGGVSGSSFPSFNTGGSVTTWGSAVFLDQGVFNGANAQAVPLVNNGSTYYSPIQRNFGGQFLEDITDLNQTNYTLRVWANGVLQTSPANYSVGGPGLAIPGSSFQGLYIQFVGTPTGPITIAGQFYFRCRLESDRQDVEEFLQQFWTIGGSSGKNGAGELKFQQSRVALI